MANKPLNNFELDYIRLCYSNGWTDQAIANEIKRPRFTVNVARRRMIADGTINQLPLPGFEPRVEDPDQ